MHILLFLHDYTLYLCIVDFAQVRHSLQRPRCMRQVHHKGKQSVTDLNSLSRLRWLHSQGDALHNAMRIHGE